MRIVFTGGGTGGHVFPNIAVIKKLRNTEKKPPVDGLEIFYIGGKKSFEEKIARQNEIPFHGINTGKLRRYFDVQNFADAIKFPVGIIEAFLILRRLRPSLIFAKGGYVSVPVALAAGVLGIPLWLHESDVSPGLSNKICSRFAEKIFLSFEETRAHFPGKVCEVVGNPIRKEIKEGSCAAGFKLTGFSEKLPVVFVLGGSSGALALNNLVYKIAPELTKEVQVIHVTGWHDAEPRKPSATTKNYRQFEFLNEELAHCYAIADLVVSRAGSGSIFETLACQKPMLLIPLPRSASRGDQVENAEVFSKNDWAHMLDQESLTPQILLKNIRELLHNKNARSDMIKNQKKAHLLAAAEQIARQILKQLQ